MSMSHLPTSELTDKLKFYEQKLKVWQQKQRDAKVWDIAAVLQIRDEIEADIEAGGLAATERMEGLIKKLVSLDGTLEDLKRNHIKDQDLDKCRQTLNPTSDNWWWQPVNSKYPFIWTFLTALCTIGIFSFTASTVQLFSIFGFNLASFFTTIGSGALGLLVGRSGLTDDGKRYIKRFLSSLGIDSRHHDRTIFMAALAIFLLMVGGAKLVAPHLVRQQLARADEAFQADNLLRAEGLYKTVLNLPNLRQETSLLANSRLGEIYESRGSWEQAETYYEAGVSQGDAQSYVDLIRVTLLQGLEASGWGNLPRSEIRQIEGLIDQAEEVIQANIPAPPQPELEAQQAWYQVPLYRELKLNEGLLNWAEVDTQTNFAELNQAEGEVLSTRFAEARNAFALILLNRFSPNALPGLSFSDTSGYTVNPELISGMVDENMGPSACFLALTGVMERDMQGFPPEQTQTMAIDTYKVCFLGEQDLGEYEAFAELARQTPPLARTLNSYVEYAATYF